MSDLRLLLAWPETANRELEELPQKLEHCRLQVSAPLSGAGEGKGLCKQRGPGNQLFLLLSLQRPPISPVISTVLAHLAPSSGAKDSPPQLLGVLPADSPSAATVFGAGNG